MKFNEDCNWMKVALKNAKYAKKKGEIPIGAVLILENCIIGSGWNNSITQNDPTAHAEIMALRQAAKKIKNYRLLNTTLYVTLQPCIMCCGAIIHSRIKRLVFGVESTKLEEKCSLKNIFSNSTIDYKLSIKKNVLKHQCSILLKNFFKKKDNYCHLKKALIMY